MKNKRWLTLDLQHFAGEGGGEGAPAASSEPAAASSSPGADPTPAPPVEPAFNFTPGWGLPKDQAANVQNPLLVTNQAPVVPEAQAPVIPAAAAPTPEVFDFGGRKIEVTDPAMLAILKDVHKDYSNLNSTFTKTNQEVQELRTTKQIYEQQIQNYQQQPPAQQTPAAQAVTPEANQDPSAELTNDQFMEQFYENPMDAVKGMLEKMIEQKVQPVLEPIQKDRETAEREREMSTEVASMTEKYPDFNDHIASMQEVLKEMPQLLGQGLEAVYFVAKGKAAQPPTQAPTPEQMLADPNFVSQHVMNNPQIQQQMISQYLQGKVQSNQLAPPMMGANGGQPPALPENKPTNLRDASKAFLKHMGW